MSERPAQRTVDVAVIGGGVIGLGIAWALAHSGRTVVVIDPDPAGGATFAAAGMLAAVSELHYREEALLDLMLASSKLYPDFIDSLGTDSDTTGYQRTTTLNVGVDAADRQALADLRAVQVANGLGVEPLTVREARVLEPMLSPQVSGAFLVEQDHQVDPRRLTARIQFALAALAPNGQDALVRVHASGLMHADAADTSSRFTGVTLADGRTIHAAEVVVANGLGAADLGGLPEHLRLPLRPVYGDVLRLRVPEHLRPLLTSTVRGLVHGVPVYLVPRTDGTLVIGATQRDDGSGAVSAGGVYQLLRDAQVLVPAVSELELIETTARARPGTPDNAPFLGRVGCSSGDIAGLIIATGFFRHGVLLTPVAAQYCLQLIEGIADDRWRNFRPDRFSASREPASAALKGGQS
ncbi:glycine oxidase ThiO [Cryobacterium sp. Y82]|uniref:glycine oxidase ThiO n=1 Tax=Cryobacterium sp. Y82 TaxID=2045017 RepID=UPI000CE35946|nr:glycine oxidase ThiO [Cryobacterium sp. Y82]